MRIQTSVFLCLAALGLACSFDSTGVGGTGGDTDTNAGDGDGDGSGDGDGDGSGDGDGDGDGDGSGDGDGDGSGDGDGDGSGDGDGDGDGAGDGDGDGAGDGDGDGDGDPCDGYTVHRVFPAADGQVSEPMAKYGEANEPPGIFAQSEVAEQGAISWKFDLECPVEVVVWGLVWDTNPGANLQADADSYWMSIDGEEPEHKWVYGCNTEGLEPGWSYQRVSHNQGAEFCELVSLTWNLSAGNHSLDFRNREGSDFQGAAAIARALVTSDAEYVPTPEAD